jgi:hypothetical protein
VRLPRPSPALATLGGGFGGDCPSSDLGPYPCPVYRMYPRPVYRNLVHGTRVRDGLGRVEARPEKWRRTGRDGLGRAGTSQGRGSGQSTRPQRHNPFRGAVGTRCRDELEKGKKEEERKTETLAEDDRSAEQGRRSSGLSSSIQLDQLDNWMCRLPQLDQPGAVGAEPTHTEPRARARE